MTQNFVKVSQEHKHIIVKNAGGLRGLTGETGPQGEPGADGQDGVSATVAIGTTTTLPAGSSATVTNTGNPQAGVFNFGIPKGDKGDKGDAGAGLIITGSVDTYADLPTGLGPDDAGKAYFVQSDGKLYVWSGTQFPADGDGSQFEGPQGPQGEQGEKGDPAAPPVAQATVSGSSITIADGGEMISLNKVLGDASQTGTPAPTSPVAVNVVTGTQTVAISNGSGNSNTYTLSLGSIELVKIGNYQDYIYKSGDDWYVHKEIGKTIFDGSQSWALDGSGIFRTTEYYNAPANSNDKILAVSDQFRGVPADDRTSGKTNIMYRFAGAGTYIYIRNTSFASSSDLVAHFTSNPATTYYVMANATDTKITDATLIAQLEALNAATLYAGTNIISTTATGTNLPAIINFTYWTWFRGPEGATGATGATGADGYSPSATVTKSGDTATITITDKDGTTTATVSDGAPGTTVYTDLTNVYYTDTTLEANWDSVNGYYVITTVSPIRTTAPLVGDKIRVQFDTAHTGSAVQIKVNSDGVLGCVAYPVTSTNADTATNITEVSTDRVYEFVKTQKTGQSAVWTSLDDHTVGSGSITGTQIASSTITSNNIDWTTIAQTNYSTTEQVWGKWTDGSTLYVKTFELHPTQSLENIQLDTLMNVIVKAEVVYDTSSGSQKNYVLAPYYVSGSDYFRFFMRTENNKTYVCSRIGSDNIQGVRSATFTFWYTK